jgi:non-heme chloroperoxidase
LSSRRAHYRLTHFHIWPFETGLTLLAIVDSTCCGKSLQALAAVFFARASALSIPSNATNYTASRLGEDVLAVIDELHLNKPVVAGHSIAGEELSYIGSHHSEKVAGLIYIEAGFPYALYDQVNGELELDTIALGNQLHQFIGGYALEPVKDYDDLIADLERVEKEVKHQQQDTKGLPPTPVSPRMTPDLFAIMDGRERFTTIHYLPS